MSTLPVNSSVQLTSAISPQMRSDKAVGGPIYSPDAPQGQPFGMAAQPYGTVAAIRQRAQQRDLPGPVQNPGLLPPAANGRDNVQPMPSALLASGKPGGHGGYGK